MRQRLFAFAPYQPLCRLCRRITAAFGQFADRRFIGQFRQRPEKSRAGQHTGTGHGDIFLRPGAQHDPQRRTKLLHPIRNTIFPGKVIDQSPAAGRVLLPGLLQGRNMTVGKKLIQRAAGFPDLLIPPVVSARRQSRCQY